MNNLDKSFSSLEKYANGKIARMKKNVDKQIKKELAKLGKEVSDKLKFYLNYWYNTYQPEDYERTYDLINSISYSIRRNKVRIFFDMRKFHTAEVNDGEGWQPHRGFDDEKFTYGLIEWIENGNFVGSSANPRANDGGIHMIENTNQWLNNYLDEETKKIIKAVIRDNYSR